jgi:hypothetical protein
MACAHRERDRKGELRFELLDFRKCPTLAALIEGFFRAQVIFKK